MMNYVNTTMEKLPPFYPVPLFLWEEPFASLSTVGKVLYGIMLSRSQMSRVNGWVDTSGRVYIVFPVKEVQQRLQCGEQKATRLMNELEDYGLIERKRQGCGKPYLIFVKLYCRSDVQW